MISASQKEIYQKISTYLDLAEELVLLAESNKNLHSKIQFEYIEKFVFHLECLTDKLAILYLDFLKNGKSSEITQEIRKTFNEISSLIQNYRSRISYH